MAEILREFDREFPSPSAFCTRMSLEEYNRIGAEQTHSELKNLMQYIDCNPKLFYEAIRKRKRDELELLPFLKVKVMSAVKGNDYLNQYFPEEECKKQLELLKDDMKSVYDLSQEVAGSPRRFSERLAAKKQNKETPAKLAAVMESPIPRPPPPPPLPKQTPSGLTNLSINHEDITALSTETVKINEELFHSLRNISGRCVKRSENQNELDKTVDGNEHDLREEVGNEQDASNVKQDNSENIEPKEVKETVKVKPKQSKKSKKLTKKLSRKNLHEEISNARKKLKSTGSEKSSPYELSKARRRKRSTEDCSFFNVALTHKFMKARSQTPSPSGSFNLSSSSFTDSPN